MQYVLKITTLGVKHHVFRVVSVDGMADVEHVLNLCDLSFAYAGYNTKELYFARNHESYRALSLDNAHEDHEHYGPTGKEHSPFWEDTVDLNALQINVVRLLEDKAAAVGRFDALIESMQTQLVQSAGQAQGTALMGSASDSCDVHPGEQQGARFKFIYCLNGVQHLVEIMTSSEKLKCFLPATLMGEGLIIDSDENKPLSCEMINECLDAQEGNEQLDDGLSLKDCTSRMRALGAMRNTDNISNAIVKAGAAPLKFKAE